MKLKRFVVKAGGLFDGANGPIIIEFSKSNLVGLVGDQETGKTTIEELILLNVGAIGGEKVLQALRNRKTGELETELEFVGNDKGNYTLRNKNGVLTVKREGEKNQNGTQVLLRKIFGIAGTSPMPIKDADVDDQVKWLAQYSIRGYDEYMKDITKNKNGQKEAKATRASANKSVKGIMEYLNGEGLIVEGDINEKEWKARDLKFKEKVDVKKASVKLDEAGKMADKYMLTEQKLKGLKERRPDQVRKIEELKAQLAAAEKALVDGDKIITSEEKYLADNKADKTSYEDAKKEFENVSKDVIAYDKWREIKKKKVEMDEFSDIAIKADSKEKQLGKDQQELQWEVIPDIRGVEIILEDTHEDEGEQRKAGFYYKGLNSRQLSASEWFGLVIQILKKNKVQFLIVDDISQFGSKFMATLNSLVESGCTVLYSEMGRGVDEIQIQYN